MNYWLRAISVIGSSLIIAQIIPADLSGFGRFLVALICLCMGYIFFLRQEEEWTADVPQMVQPYSPTLMPQPFAPQTIDYGQNHSNPIQAAPATNHSQPQATAYPEAQIVDDYFYHRELPFGVREPVCTPDYMFYMIEKQPGSPVKLATLSSHMADIANEIYTYRGGGEAVRTTFNELPPYIKVTNAQRALLPWSGRSTNLPANIAQLGMHWVHTNAQLVTVNPIDQKQCHIGVFASSGGGKSILINILAVELMARNSPDAVEFYFIDLDSNQFDAYEDLPHVRYVAKTEDQALKTLYYLKSLVEGNRSGQSKVRRYLVIDELQMLTDQSDYSDEICDALTIIMQRGRKHNFNCILATQDPTGANYPTPLQRNTKVVLAGATEDDSYLKRFFKIKGASNLRGDGDFIFKCGIEHHNFKAYWFGPEEKSASINEIKARWGANGTTLRFSEEHAQEAHTEEEYDIDEYEADEYSGAEPEYTDGDYIEEDAEQTVVLAEIELPQKLSKREKRIAQDADLIRDDFEDAYNFDEGCVREGWGVALIEQIYGEAKPNSGSYATRLQEAVNYLLEEYNYE